MRRYRPTNYWPAILTVAIGIAATPSTVGAGEESVAPTDGSTAAPETPEEPPAPPATTPEPPSTTPEPPAPTTPEPPVTTTPEPPSTTTPEPPSTPTPEPEPAPPVEEPPVTTVPPPVDETPPEDNPPADDPDEDEDDDNGVPHELLPDGIVRPISFPVLGPVHYGNDWGACRDGCARRHQGTDMIGVRMQPLLAAVDGTVTRVRFENRGTAGAVITITGADGWYYNYFHLNNDTPGTDDGVAGPEWQINPQLALGSKVRAGQVIGYMGDSGNAEGSVPHLHFEIRRPDRIPVNPYHSLMAAQRILTCAGDDLVPVLPAEPTPLSPLAVAVIPIDGGGQWLIDRDGRLLAEGSAARVETLAGVDCDAVEADVAEQPLVRTPDPVTVPVAPVAEPTAPAPEPAAPAPAAPAPTPWTVEGGQSLWGIVQESYGVSDVSSTASLVQFVFDHNREQLTDPDAIEVGMNLLLPPILL